VDVDAEGELPFLIVNVINGFEARLVRGIVDEDIDATELCDGLVNEVAALIGSLNVTADQERFPAGLLDPSLGLRRIFVLAEIGDEGVSALPRVGDGDGPPDATVGAGE
jgi:hypothetical protein